MTPTDKNTVRNEVSWIMMQTPPEYRKTDLRGRIKDAIRRLRGLDRAAQSAVEGTPYLADEIRRRLNNGGGA